MSQNNEVKANKLLNSDNSDVLNIPARTDEPAGTLVEGDAYWDSDAEEFRIYNGAMFVSPGGGGGANTSLSNLTDPTAINQDLIFDVGAPRTVMTKNVGVDENSEPLSVKTGDVLGVGVSGSLNFSTGSSVDGTSSAINFTVPFPVGSGTQSAITFSADHVELNSIDNNHVVPLQFWNAANTNYTALKAGLSTTDVTFTLPIVDGTSGQVLKTDGTGILSWDDPNAFQGVKVLPADITTPTGNTQVTFTSADEEYSTDVGFTTTANRITVVAEGYYLLTAAAQVNSGTTGTADIYYSINGSSQEAILKALTTNAGASDALYSVSTPLFLEEGDYLEFFVENANNDSVTNLKFGLNSFGGAAGSEGGGSGTLANNTYFNARNGVDSADIGLFRLTSNDWLEFGSTAPIIVPTNDIFFDQGATRGIKFGTPSGSVNGMSHDNTEGVVIGHFSDGPTQIRGNSVNTHIGSGNFNLKGDGGSNTARLNLYNQGNSAAIGLKSPDGLGGSFELTFPSDVGSPGQALATDGTTGQLSWSNVGGNFWVKQTLTFEDFQVADTAITLDLEIPAPVGSVLRGFLAFPRVLFEGTNPDDFDTLTNLSIRGGTTELPDFINLGSNSLVGTVHPEQSLTFSSEPILGNFKLEYNGSQTADIPFNVSDTDLQTAIRTITGWEAALVKPGGTVVDGFLIRGVGVTSNDPLQVLDNTLIDINTDPVNVDTNPTQAYIAYLGMISDCKDTVITTTTSIHVRLENSGSDGIFLDTLTAGEIDFYVLVQDLDSLALA